MRKIWLTALLTVFLSVLLSQSVLAQTDGGYVPVPKSKNTYPAYITDIYTKKGKTYVVADYIQWFEGKEADRIFLQKEPDSGLEGAPDGYYIVNDNPKLRTFEVKRNAEVLMQIYNRNGKANQLTIIWNEPITFDKFTNIFAKDNLLKGYPYHLTISNGKISKIVQQYIP
jgi:hypothetical protein